MKYLKPILFTLVFFLLASCATISNPDKWLTVEVDKHWPDNYKSWTYKRCCGQNLIWALFGNDTDGVTPYFKGEPWPFWKWWLRNRWSNFGKFVIGYARWEEGNPYAIWDTSHLEYCHVIGDWESLGFVHIGVKPKNRPWWYWRPYFGIHLPPPFPSAWIGWKRRGWFACSIKVEHWGE